MKISFVELSHLDRLLNALSPDERAEAEFYISQTNDMADVAEEILAQISHGCIVFRNYSTDTGYYFQSPLPLSENADTAGAFRDISEYCRLEAIPECIVGIPEEDLEIALEGVKHRQLFETDDGTFVLKVMTECMLADALPELMYEDVYLGEFALSYAKDYEKLVTDRHLNRFFGYNVTEDIKNGTGEDFIREARREFNGGEAMTFAATVLSDTMENIFIGEGTLYAFDGRGGASIAFRVLPQWQGKGYGRKIYKGLLEIARKLSLDNLSAEVLSENLPSLGLLRGEGAQEELLDGKSRFSILLNTY